MASLVKLFLQNGRCLDSGRHSVPSNARHDRRGVGQCAAYNVLG